MKIFVRRGFYAEQELVFRVEAFFTIAKVKDKIRKKLGLQSTDHVHLAPLQWAAQEFDDEVTLAKYKVQDGATLILATAKDLENWEMVDWS